MLRTATATAYTVPASTSAHSRRSRTYWCDGGPAMHAFIKIAILYWSRNRRKPELTFCCIGVSMLKSVGYLDLRGLYPEGGMTLMIGTCGCFLKYAETYSVKGFEKSFFEGLKTGHSFDFPTIVTARNVYSLAWLNFPVAAGTSTRPGGTAWPRR